MGFDLKGYVEPIQVATSLRLDYSDPQTIGDIKDALAMVETAVDQYCGMSFEKDDGAARTYNGENKRTLSLAGLLRTLDKVEVLDANGAAVAELQYVYKQPANPFRKDLAGNPLYSWLELPEGSAFPCGLSNVRVTGDWGMDGVAKPVQYAIVFAVRHFMAMSAYDSTVVLDAGLGRTQQLRDPKEIDYLPEFSKRLLDPYVHRGLVE